MPSPRRTIPVAIALITPLLAWGVAQASFPPASPAVANTLSLSGRGQDVAVNTTNNIVYAALTGAENKVTAYDPITGLVAAQADVGGSSLRIAVNSRTGTVYVPGGDTLQVMPGDLSSRIDHPLPFLSARAVAVHPADDTVYVNFPGFGINKLGILNGNNLDDSVFVQMNSNQYAMAVNPLDDTVYVSYSFGSTISMVSGDGSSVLSVSLPAPNPSSMTFAVNPIDGTVYMGDQLRARLVIAPPDLSSFTSVALPSPITGVSGLSVSPDGSTLWVAARQSSSQGMALNTADLDDSYIFTTGPSSFAVSATNRFAAMIENDPGQINILAWPGLATSIVPASSPVAGGVPVTVTGSGFIPGVTSVTVGGNALQSAQVINATTITGVVPPGVAGQADVVVSTWALTETLVGAVTYLPPPAPASAPLDVVAVAGDRSSVVSWAAPASSGSFAVSTYQVQASPGGRVCLVEAPDLMCTLNGLTNGTTYTFEVRALTGAGWSRWSESSNAVTPGPGPLDSVVISGTRAEVRGGSGVVVTGSATGFGMGGVLRPWVRPAGRTSFVQGSARILVDIEGGFTWQRRGVKTVSVFVESPDGSTRSNAVTISAR